MRYHERLNIIFMRDNGPRRSIRLRRSRLYLLIIFFSSMPFLCLLLGVQCYLLWIQNVELRANVGRFEADYQAAEARAERLENLEELLNEENVQSREILLRNLASSPQSRPSTDSPEEKAAAELPEGPGHEDFPALNTGRVKVSNVQPRILKGNSLRLGLDLTNPAKDQLLSGSVHAILTTQDGEKYRLQFSPQDIGNFRINRFKRTVMTARLPRHLNLVNAEIIVEVVEENGEPIYRNIFGVQH